MSSEMNVKINKKSWSTEEDAKLMKLIEELGVSGSWTMISSKMGDRSGKQCRERYHNHLKSDINKSAFTKEEDEMVNALQAKLGNQWAKISKYFNGRSDNAVKNRWHIINRCKPAVEASPATVVAAAVAAAPRRPVVPMLALNPTPAHTTCVDLQSYYHSHSEHCHEPTASSRSLVPSSGRRSARSSLQSLNLHSEGHYCSSDSDSDDTWLDELLSESYYSSSSEEEEEEWGRDEVISQKEITYLLSTNIFDASPRADDAEHGPEEEVEEEEESQTDSELPRAAPVAAAPVVIYDAFSEAALTQRSDPEEFEFAEEGDACLDDLAEDMFQFDGVISVKASPAFNPNVLSLQLQGVGTKDNTVLGRKLNPTAQPRLTPRSPACPNVKRHRGVRPEGSPLIRCL